MNVARRTVCGVFQVFHLVRWPLFGLDGGFAGSGLGRKELVELQLQGPRVLGLAMLQQEDEQECHDGPGHVHAGEPRTDEAEEESGDGPGEDHGEDGKERDGIAHPPSEPGRNPIEPIAHAPPEPFSHSSPIPSMGS